MNKKIVCALSLVLFTNTYPAAAPGTLDTTFGVNGIAQGPIIQGTDSTPNSIALQADGKIISAGYADLVSTTTTVFTLERFNTDGSLDTSFGINGVAQGPIIHSNNSQIQQIAIQSDGKIVATGIAYDSTNTYTVFTLLRFNIDGSLDTTFGTSGIAQGHVIQNANSQSNAIVIQPNGSIVIAGWAKDSTNTNNVFTLMRFNANGYLETFGTGGIAQGPILNSNDSYVNAVTLQKNGMIVVAGVIDGDSNIAVERFNSNGFIDTSFGTNGATVVPTINNHNSLADAIAVQSNGKIITTGWATDVTQTNIVFTVVQLNSNGSIDTTFGTNGIAQGPLLNGSDSYGSFATLQNNGMIVVAGVTYYGGGAFNIALERFTPQGTLDTTFGVNGVVVGPVINNFNSNANSVVLQPDGKIVTTGIAHDVTDSNYVFTVERWNGINTTDPFALALINKYSSRL